MRALASFGRFWWAFVIGDDWSVAVAVVAAIGVTTLTAHSGITAWWILPLAVAVVLYVSLMRAVRR